MNGYPRHGLPRIFEKLEARGFIQEEKEMRENKKGSKRVFRVFYVLK